MRAVEIADLENAVDEYVGYAKAGETIVITENGVPVAQLEPYPMDHPIKL